MSWQGNIIDISLLFISWHYFFQKDVLAIVRDYERGFSRYIGLGPGEPRRSLWISKGPHSLSHRCFIYIFSFFCGVFTTQIPNFEREVSAYPQGPKTVLVRLAKFLLTALTIVVCEETIYQSYRSTEYVTYLLQTMANSSFFSNCDNFLFLPFFGLADFLKIK